MRTVLLFIVLYLSSCCGSSNWSELPVGVSVVTAQDERALEIVNETFGQEIFVVDGDSDAIVFSRVSNETFLGDDMFLAATTINSSGCELSSSTIEVKTAVDANPPLALNIAAHELFHALGFKDHTNSEDPDNPNIMDPDAVAMSEAQVVDAINRDTVLLQWLCNAYLIGCDRF